MATLTEAIFIEGEVVPAEDAKISVLDRGFLYGDSVYETMRVYEGVPFELNAHLKRLHRSAERIDFTLPYNFSALVQAVEKTLKASTLRNALMRVVCTRGRSAQGYWTQSVSNAQLMVMHLELPALPESLYKNGRSACFVSDRWGAGDPRAKTGNRMRGILATLDAQKANADEAILLNAEGEVTEAASANVFVEIEGKWHTPPCDAEILPGITRQTVLAEARSAGITIHEHVLRKEQLYKASAIFICSSVRELLPIVELNGRPVADGRVPESYTHMRALYHGAVQRQCGIVERILE